MPTSRIADHPYDTPSDPLDVSGPPAHVTSRPGVALLGRILLSAIFLISGFGKLVDPGATAHYMANTGIPYADVLAVVAGVAELAGGIAILFGLLSRTAAACLVLYLIPVTLIFHNFWSFEGGEQRMQMANFMKNLAVMGGLLMVSAFGPGRYSVDGGTRRPRSGDAWSTYR